MPTPIQAITKALREAGIPASNHQTLITNHGHPNYLISDHDTAVLVSCWTQTTSYIGQEYHLADPQLIPKIIKQITA